MFSVGSDNDRYKKESSSKAIGKHLQFKLHTNGSIHIYVTHELCLLSLIGWLMALEDRLLLNEWTYISSIFDGHSTSVPVGGG
jgi:hypothetical protein